MRMWKKRMIGFGGLVIVISLVLVVVLGRSYTFRLPKDEVGTTDIEVEIEDDLGEENENDILELTSVTENDEEFLLMFQGKNEGRVFVRMSAGDYEIYRFFYVHMLNVVTQGEFFGDMRGGIVIPMGLLVILTMILVYYIQEYREGVRENLYQYKNITRMGMILFILFMIIMQVFACFDYAGIIQSINDIMGLFGTISGVMMPVTFVVTVIISVSNIILMRREGVSFRNMLGAILGIVFCVMTVAPKVAGEWLETTDLVDIHNQGGAALYVWMFIENAIYIVTAYLGCILVGTIVVSVKAARRVPDFRQDYLIILGCYVGPDGEPGGILRKRIERAKEFRDLQLRESGRKLKFVASGGKGTDEKISEAEGIRRYLRGLGISDSEILVENKSRTTMENFKYSSEVIREDYEAGMRYETRARGAKREGKVAAARPDAAPAISFATTNYHVFRAGIFANSLGINAEGIGARAKSYFWINAFVREYVATLATERKRHLITLILLLVLDVATALAVWGATVY